MPDPAPAHPDDPKDARPAAALDVVIGGQVCDANKLLKLEVRDLPPEMNAVITNNFWELL